MLHATVDAQLLLGTTAVLCFVLFVGFPPAYELCICKELLLACYCGCAEVARLYRLTAVGFVKFER